MINEEGNTPLSTTDDNSDHVNAPADNKIEQGGSTTVYLLAISLSATKGSAPGSKLQTSKLSEEGATSEFSLWAVIISSAKERPLQTCYMRNVGIRPVHKTAYERTHPETSHVQGVVDFGLSSLASSNDRPLHTNFTKIAAEQEKLISCSI